MTKRPHHHGNLREALILAGLEILVEGGAEALTLRKCAARAGVSHAAPAHHFKGLGSLKLAIVSRGHMVFANFMREARDRASKDPMAKLTAIGEGYVLFAKTHTVLFKFMFLPRELGPDLFDSQSWEQFLIESAQSYRVLHDACVPFEHGPVGQQGTEVMVWSLVHGYAMLFGEKSDLMTQYDTIPDFGELLPMLRVKE